MKTLLTSVWIMPTYIRLGFSLEYLQSLLIMLFLSISLTIKIICLVIYTWRASLCFQKSYKSSHGKLWIHQPQSWNLEISRKAVGPSGCPSKAISAAFIIHPQSPLHQWSWLTTSSMALYGDINLIKTPGIQGFGLITSGLFFFE